MQLRLPTHNVQRMMPYHFLENHPYSCYSKSKSYKQEKPIVNLRTVQEQRVYGYYHPMLDHENKHGTNCKKHENDIYSRYIC